jgi:hypothetical protein
VGEGAERAQQPTNLNPLIPGGRDHSNCDNGSAANETILSSADYGIDRISKSMVVVLSGDEPIQKQPDEDAGK